MDLSQLLSQAEEICTEAEHIFLDGLGADPTTFKAPGDFATDVDVHIEELLRTRLNQLTGIPVFGEEQGGSLNHQAVWVVDPVDGTSNYAAGNPLCAILMSLIIDQKPVIGITSLPTLGRRLSAYRGSPLLINGSPFRPESRPSTLVGQVGFSSVSSPAASKFPSMVRQGLLSELADTYLRPRITGSVGVDLAFSAQGIFGGAVSFSPHIWDNAAGVVLNRAVGGYVTDTSGQPWTIHSDSCVVGSPQAHSAIMATMSRNLPT
ncbi:inositol monophosphatase [Corynebacterium sp. 3HC-13]|uniref:inositol monophosphatase family protein n=1 Tax=Corynebacterium poyangense TaxID=2684405 RepID=UPI001CCFFE2F|nr:inositol monophosphatase family protein [Corynebacterium poyangense]MBZ8178100.1 inositol monophosphatase [Corynebacterium poyangense]